MLVDSHCHLDRLKLDGYDNGLDDAIAEAKSRGVSHMLCVCISEENKDVVVDIARQFPQVYASVGIHPCDVKENVVGESDLLAWSQMPKVVALGETGLDYYYSKESERQQKESFARHLSAAGTLGLPVIVHTREARDDTIDLIRGEGNSESAGVLHCFTEDWEMAKKALDLNYYISISGIVTFKTANQIRDVVTKMPLDRLLIETDSPYLAPVPYRGKSNEPKYVREVAEYIAELLNISLEQVAESTTANFFRLFDKAKA
ncbi:TatD family hydrolase [Agarilytica rhodophyticola]|uniref:TatD family hydrolase n=1 Tax=Agarilytica rhodophyticola TaxID=1737490 RepID=UPI000B344673|nr:TatD family hydrolase [Agarilytica rhodophyticola]